MTNNKFTFIDLFAGIGGFHQAMNSRGGKCVFTSEWDKHAADTYYQNYGIEPNGDITQIEAKEIPLHDVLCGGFPCQAFSISGNQKGFEDIRGNLFFDILRIVSHHKPKVLLLENVRNFERHDGGRTLERVLYELDKVGYDVSYEVLNASHYGLPQNRQRIYFVCFRKDLKIKGFKFADAPHKSVCLHDILESSPTDAKIVTRSATFFKRKDYKPEVALSGEVIFPNRPIQIGYVNKGGQGERIYSPYGHAVTLSAYGGGVGSKTGLYFIDDQIRKLSVRECARLQGFPDDFKIVSSQSQSYKQFGNSVAIPVLKQIIDSIIETKVLEIANVVFDIGVRLND